MHRLRENSTFGISYFSGRLPILPEDKKIAYAALFPRSKKQKIKTSVEFRIKRPDGSIRYILARTFKLEDVDHNTFVVVGIAVDLTQVTLEKKYKQIQYNLSNLIASEKNIMVFFHKTLKMFGELSELQLSELWLVDESRHVLFCVDTWHVDNKFIDDFVARRLEHTFKIGEGLPGSAWETKTPFFISDYSDNPAYFPSGDAKIAGLNNAFGIPIVSQGKIFGVIEFFSSNVIKPDAGLLTLLQNMSRYIGDYIIHTKELEKIRVTAKHDLLTGLLNRSALEDKLDRLIASKKSKSIAVLVLDIDRFKLINESLGHEFGDKLLIVMGRRLNEVVRQKRVGLARLEADQYILYIQDATRQDALEYSQTIQRNLKDSFNIDKSTINVSVSIGIAIYPQDGLDSKSLVINANLAMRMTKGRGGDRIDFFTKDLPVFASQAITMKADLRAALQSTKQFILEYQPQVDLKTGDVCAAEVLVRWQHPIRGLLYPDQFIPLAEKYRIISTLNEHVLRMAFKQISLMELRIPVSINISAQQFEDGFHLVEYLELLMKEFAVNSKQIELEITENSLVDDTEHNIAVLKALHELGYMIAIDDFGIGYSSFSYLNRLPVQKIKIDKAFITGLPTNLANVKIVKALIVLAHALDKMVVAEGAETEAEVEFLKQENCDIVQGFYYYKPMSLVDLRAIIAKQ